jgi:hypothetical protein
LRVDTLRGGDRWCLIQPRTRATFGDTVGGDAKAPDSKEDDRHSRSLVCVLGMGAAEAGEAAENRSRTSHLTQPTLETFPTA